MTTDGEAKPGWAPIWPLLFVALLLFVSGALFPPAEDEPGLINDPVAWGIHAIALGLVLTFALHPGPPAAPASEVPLCTHCLGPYAPVAHFCPRCSCPQTFFAATAFYERVYAQVWMLGKAARHPSRGLHVVGLSLVTVPAVAYLFLPLLFLPLAAGAWTFDLGQVLGWVALAPYACAHALLLLHGLRSWRRHLRGRPPVPRDYEVAPWWTYDRWLSLPDPAEPSANADVQP